MRKTTFVVGLLLAVLIIVINKPQTSAMSLLDLENKEVLAMADSIVAYSNKDEVKAPAQEHVKHTVKKGESLSKIAKIHKSSWQRIFHKNISLEHPDVINPGTELIIPSADEKLAERALPASAAEQSDAPQKPTQATQQVRGGTQRGIQTSTSPATATQSRGSSAGNRYVRGYCTWYVKNRRPDIPNNLGNANTWVSRARAQGLPTGSMPRVGAVGQQGMHVVYVEAVNGNGTVTVSEMNFRGHGIVSSRTVPASSFQYIY